jgi:dipeptide/tripeptide permease
LQRQQRDVAHFAEWYERRRLIVLVVDDRSFVRFGGLAAILLALTSWAALLAYAALPRQGDGLREQIFQLLYALVAFWALVAVVAVHHRIRSVGEAWAFFATLVGVAASVGSMVAGMYEIANLRQSSPQAGFSPADPLGVLSFGLTGVWFLVANLLLWRTRTPRVLVLLGFVVAALLFAAFVASLSANRGAVALASLIVGAVGGPVYWLWLGRQLRRDT